ncbi:MAG: hypothetical protein WEB58_03055 [Planctomycetaceae bacterium]
MNLNRMMKPIAKSTRRKITDEDGRDIPRLSVGKAATGANAIGAHALGALAVGAIAIGAVAIGRLAIRRLHVRDAKVRSLHVGELTVDRLTVRELHIENSGDASGTHALVQHTPAGEASNPPGHNRSEPEFLHRHRSEY